MTAPIKVVHAFSGIDGFGQGFGDDFETTAHIEINKHCRKVLAEHVDPTIPIMEDITDVHGQDIGRPRVACAGFPCQDTSIAAPHRRGLDGARSHKFYEFARLLDEYAILVDSADPYVVVIENPSGILGSRDGRDMAAVIWTLRQLGYGVAWRTVDGGSPGTPQHRARTLFVGVAGGDPRPAWEILGGSFAGGEAARPHHNGRQEPEPTTGAFVVGDSLLRHFRKGARPRVALSKGYEGGYRETWVDDGRANVLTGFDGGLATRQTHLVIQDGRPRTYTLTEWERMMGFPDGHTAMVPDSQRYPMLGNAFHVGSARWLGQGIADFIRKVPQLKAS